MSTVLVVEDDRAILEALAYSLRREGHTVLTSEDGVSGLRHAREDEPDLIVLDLMLPRMSGIDVCRIVRSEGPVPIVMLTARDAEGDKVAGLNLGADDYVTKPFSMRELMARVNALLRRDRLSRDASEPDVVHGVTLTAGDITLDTLAHEVRRSDVVVALRPKEYELLEYLLRHPNHALTRDQILETAWGYLYGGGTRTVDVHVRWLREKLESNPAVPERILTVRGVGYKLAP